MLKISIVVGNPKPQSRTLKVAQTLAEKLFDSVEHQLEVIDLADYAEEIFRWPNDNLTSLNAKVAASDVAIFASPTYKATYTGLLKAFLDRYPANGLSGVVAIPVMTGADQTHSLGTFTFLPVFAELGAIVPGRGFYFVTSQMDRLDSRVQEIVDEYSRNFSRLAHVGAFATTKNENSLSIEDIENFEGLVK